MAEQTQSILNKSSKDKFVLYLGLPPILEKLNSTNQKDRTGDTVNLNALQFSVYGTLIPASFVQHHEARFHGQTLKVTSMSRPSLPNITVKFVVDNGFRNYYLLWKWLSVMNHEKFSTYNQENYETLIKSIPNAHEYMTDLVVYGKDEYEKNIVKFTYRKAFITRLENFTYDNQDTEKIESSFEFAFSQFEMELV